MGTTFPFCNKVHFCHPQGWERVKNFDPSGVAFFPFLSSLSSQFSLASVVLRPLLAEYRTPPRPPPKEEDL